MVLREGISTGIATKNQALPHSETGATNDATANLEIFAFWPCVLLSVSLNFLLSYSLSVSVLSISRAFSASDCFT